MITDEIRARLIPLGEPAYRELQLRTIPTLSPSSVIGVRTPTLRKLAGELSAREDISVFLSALPHDLFEENQLHAFVLSGMRSFEDCLSAVSRFLPYVDNWATCDQMSPKVFARHRAELTEPVRAWIAGGHTYTVRFGIKMLMDHYLDEAFDPAYLDLAASVRSDEYYVRMMVAWYFATALAKQYPFAVRVLEQRRLDPWTHNKTIRKAVESFRIAPEQKTWLRGLKV